MNATHVTLAEAHDRLAELVDAAKRGDEVYIDAENNTQVKLEAAPARQPRVLGAYRGKLRMHPDFSAPLSADFWLHGQA